MIFERSKVMDSKTILQYDSQSGKIAVDYLLSQGFKFAKSIVRENMVYTTLRKGFFLERIVKYPANS
jgi:hypothetical protein